jgi:hypothetical protein
MTAIVMVAALISMSSLTMIHTLPVEATRPRHNDNDIMAMEMAILTVLHGNRYHKTRVQTLRVVMVTMTVMITMTLHCSKCSNNKKQHHQTQHVDK